MNTIILDAISKAFGGRILFENVSASFTEGKRYGLSGPNGAGKSTLLKIMMGVEEASSGTVRLPKRVGFLRQNLDAFANMTLLDVVLMGNERLHKALQEREELYATETEAGPEGISDAMGMRLGELECIVAEEDGYTAESRVEVLLAGLGLPPQSLVQKMKTLPTDLQFRVLLCQALFGDPEALLLDEPTNHLDLASISWLEDFLLQYTGVLIVVSHDRHFLNAVTTHIADIDYDTIIHYPGNYDAMVYAKSSTREREEHNIKSGEKKVAKLKGFVAKFAAGTRASQVQSRMKEISRLQPQELKKSNIQRPYIRFIESEKRPGRSIFKLKKISKSYENIDLFNSFSGEISRGDKIGVIGNNGCGKTTLLRLLVKEIEATNGSIEQGHQVQVAYFPQMHAELVQKDDKSNAFDWLKNKSPRSYDQDIRSVLGKMLFAGDDAFKTVSSLSGGETARLILSYILLQKHNVLILDEPNNHLDLEAVSALSWALSEYPGTVIVVSHDRDLISQVAERLVIFDKEDLRIYDGSLEEYLATKNS